MRPAKHPTFQSEEGIPTKGYCKGCYKASKGVAVTVLSGSIRVTERVTVVTMFHALKAKMLPKRNG